jgi:hypothetical protein
MNRSRGLSFAFSFALTTAALACGTSSGETSEHPSQAAAAPILRGVYRSATVDPSANIQELSFRDTHYRLMPVGCDEALCEETGTFALDFASGRLDLVADASGKRSSFPFAVLATELGPPSSDARRDRGCASTRCSSDAAA